MTAPQDIFAIGRVAQLVTDCLVALVDAAASLSVSLPGRQIAGAGGIPYDCEQVVATVVQIATGAPESTIGPRAGGGTYPNAGANVTIYQATIQLAVVRCTKDTPTGPMGNTPPTAAAYLENLTNASRDAAVVLSAITRIAERELATSAVPRTLTIGTPAGGLVATSARILVVV